MSTQQEQSRLPSHRQQTQPQQHYDNNFTKNDQRFNKLRQELLTNEHSLNQDLINEQNNQNYLVEDVDINDDQQSYIYSQTPQQQLCTTTQQHRNPQSMSINNGAACTSTSLKDQNHINNNNGGGGGHLQQQQIQQQVYETADFYPQHQTNANTNAHSVNSSNLIGNYLQPSQPQQYDSSNLQQDNLDAVRVLGLRQHGINNRGIISPDDLEDDQYEIQNYIEDEDQQIAQQNQQFDCEGMIEVGAGIMSTGGQAFNSIQMMSQESQQRHYNILKQQEYQLLKERESLIYGSQNDANIYSSGMGNIEEISNHSYPISVSPTGDISNRNYQSIENPNQGLPSQRQSQRSQQVSNFQQFTSQAQRSGIGSHIKRNSDNVSNDMHNQLQDFDYDYSQSRIDQNYDFLTQSQASQFVDQNNSNFLIMSNQVPNSAYQQQNNMLPNTNTGLYPDTQAFLFSGDQMLEQPYQDDINQIHHNNNNNNQVVQNQVYDYNIQQLEEQEQLEDYVEQQQVMSDQDVNTIQTNDDINDEEDFDEDEAQRELSESLNLNDQEFNDNLKILYQRRIQSTQKTLDAISIEQQKSQNQQDFIQNLRNQLLNNKNNCISQLKIKHHMLVLKLDNLMEQAMDEIFTKEAQQMEVIDQLYKQNQDNNIELESLAQMLDLKMKMEKKTKFVQFFPDMMKQCDKVLTTVTNNDISRKVDPLLSKLEAPQFEYQILSKNEYEELQNNKLINDNPIIDKAVQCNMDAQQLQQHSKVISDVIINDTHSQISRRTVDRNELDEQARSISRQLKHLKKETEYAKKIILNEKKLDHLIGVLDKSKEQIFRNSIDAYENNQSLIQDQINKSVSKIQRSASQMGSISVRNDQQQQNQHNSSRNAIQQQQQQNQHQHSQSISISNNKNNYTHNDSYILSDRAFQDMKSRVDLQNRILRSNASVSSIHNENNNDNSTISYNMMSDEFQNQNKGATPNGANVPLRQKMKGLSQLKKHSLQTLDPKLTPSSFNNQQQQTVILPTPQTLNQEHKYRNQNVFKSDIKLQSHQYPHNSFRKNLNEQLDYSHQQPLKQQQKLTHHQSTAQLPIRDSINGDNLMILNPNNCSTDNINMHNSMPHTTTNQQYHNRSVNIIHHNNNPSIVSNISYQNTYAGDYFDKLSKRNNNNYRNQNENDQSSSNHSIISSNRNMSDYHQVREGKITSKSRHRSTREDVNQNNKSSHKPNVTEYQVKQQSHQMGAYSHQQSDSSQNIASQKPKQKSVKFSVIKQKPFDNNTSRQQQQNQGNSGGFGHFIIYLPFGGCEPYTTYYDCIVYKQGKFPVSKFLLKLLRHARIPSHERERFFLQIELKGASQYGEEPQQQRRILNVDEDINRVLGSDSRKWPISLYLKESQYL